MGNAVCPESIQPLPFDPAAFSVKLAAPGPCSAKWLLAGTIANGSLVFYFIHPVLRLARPFFRVLQMLQILLVGFCVIVRILFQLCWRALWFLCFLVFSNIFAHTGYL